MTPYSGKTVALIGAILMSLFLIMTACGNDDSTSDKPKKAAGEMKGEKKMEPPKPAALKPAAPKPEAPKPEAPKPEAKTGEAPKPEAADFNPKEPVVTVNGVPIMRAEFELEKQRLMMAQQQQGVFVQKTHSILEREALDNLISVELLFQEGKKKGVSVDENTVSKKFGQIKARFKEDAVFQKVLAERGLTEDELLAELRRGLTVETYIIREFRDKIQVDEAEMKAFYEQHSARFDMPEMVRASHILIKVDPKADQAAREKAKKEAEALRQQAMTGADFAQLARTHSQGPSSARGGDLGYFARGRMVKAFDEAVFSLKPGELSDIVQTRFGYHVIKLTDRKPAGPIGFEEVKKDIKTALTNEKLQKSLDVHLRETRKNADINFLLPSMREQPKG